MKISEVIQKMKDYHRGTVNGVAIDESTTRDKILFGNPDQECTGIVTTCYASVEVIRKARQLNANLIISHEALFWNHGDHTDWLEETENKTYLEKKKLLEEGNLVVWRDHDYIHSGIPVHGEFVEGICYGVKKTQAWEKALGGWHERPLLFEIEPMTVREVGRHVMDKFRLTGLKMLGNPDAIVRKVWIPGHIMGGDNDAITRIDRENIDLLIALELIDYTVSEYIRDSAMLGQPKAVLAAGHFNVEEPGMEYMVHYIPQALGVDIPCHYVQSGDMYCFLSR